MQARREKAVARGLNNVTGIYADSASGSIVKDVDGNEYIDFAGGIGIQNTGHNHPKVVKAIQEQLSKLIHPCFHVTPYEVYIKLAERLNELTPGDFSKKTMLANSGAEANENAIKMARKYTGKPGIIVFDRAFHGRTLLTMSLTGKVMPYKKGFGPFPGDIYRLPYPYYYRSDDGLSRDEVDELMLNSLHNFFQFEADKDNIAALLIEPVQGEGGFVAPTATFMKGLKKFCTDNGIVFIADEIQTGFCRTGKMFAMEHFGVEPDLVTMSKSIAGGMPLSAVTGRAGIVDAPEAGQLGGTLGGSPVACAAGLAVLDVIEEEHILDRSVRLGEKIQGAFKRWQTQYEAVGDVRGLGPMCAIELVKDKKTKEPAKELTANIVKRSWQQGLIVLSSGLYSNVLRFLPPLTMDEKTIDKGLTILEKVIKEESKKIMEFQGE
ncbi:4-aminobutyrate--2-oxoglutarate transaminase [Siminovitchia fortis]|uniref:(S)-3-amino-2-methylpropionate transaminase n=1 Tax=Siminovitchia fortis TaxID=254758 RepID=A0A443IRS6_9BACI|nr:4-aminobutyrate--2-oxoglutarate transaminase [Siminovitchia fortis]RWR10095.1 4-aminobutyrate--2-oxoglutarate transaminase [Siminovitchia fortis]WHY83759.1 4-aminobutyrate--2-oxoglutarate transaminase [Siminovitchia fortis]